MLLFDEADALFGKRTEVRDSHDRYANLEVGYLLQRIEAFDGLAILTTNASPALDPAFLRRLRVVVTFPYPDQTLREALWRRAFPERTPAPRPRPAASGGDRPPRRRHRRGGADRRVPGRRARRGQRRGPRGGDALGAGQARAHARRGLTATRRTAADRATIQPLCDSSSTLMRPGLQGDLVRGALLARRRVHLVPEQDGDEPRIGRALAGDDVPADPEQEVGAGRSMG